MIGSGRESLQEVWEALRCLGVVGRPSRLSGNGGSPSWMTGNCLEALPNVWESLPDVRVLLGGPPRCPGVVGSLSRMSGVVGRPSWMSVSCLEALPKV